MVNPPEEVLQEGLLKFKNCVIGTFTKKIPSFPAVSDFSKIAWNQKGLVKVLQKDAGTFLFRFNSEVNMNNV